MQLPPHTPKTLTSRHRDLPFQLRAYFLDHGLAECFVKENGGGISRLLCPVSKLGQARHSDVLGKVEGEELVLVVDLGEPHARAPVLTVHRVLERVVLQAGPPPCGCCRGDRAGQACSTGGGSPSSVCYLGSPAQWGEKKSLGSLQTTSAIKRPTV